MSFDPSSWGTVADWVAAVGSAGALGAAVYLIHREAEDRRADRKDREEAQARLATVWVNALAGGVRRLENGVVVVDPAPPWAIEAFAEFTNASTMPLRNVHAAIYIDVLSVAEATQAAVLPGEQIELRGEVSGVESPGLNSRAVVIFTDVDGRDWTLESGKRVRRTSPDDLRAAERDQ